MLLRLNEVYAGEVPRNAPGHENEKRILKGIRAKVRQTVKDRW